MTDDLHGISSQLGRILKALEKIGDEIEKYNEKHKWDYPQVQTVPYTPPTGWTCWQCGQWIGHGQTHFCYGTTTWAGKINYNNNSTFNASSNPNPEI